MAKKPLVTLDITKQSRFLNNLFSVENPKIFVNFFVIKFRFMRGEFSTFLADELQSNQCEVAVANFLKEVGLDYSKTENDYGSIDDFISTLKEHNVLNFESEMFFLRSCLEGHELLLVFSKKQTVGFVIYAPLSESAKKIISDREETTGVRISRIDIYKLSDKGYSFGYFSVKKSVQNNTSVVFVYNPMINKIPKLRKLNHEESWAKWLSQASNQFRPI